MIREWDDFNEKIKIGVYNPSQNFYNEKVQEWKRQIQVLSHEINLAKIGQIGRMKNEFYKEMGYKEHSREERNERMCLDREKKKTLQKELEELEREYEIAKKNYTKAKPNSTERRNCYQEVCSLKHSIDSKKKEINLVGCWQWEDTFKR